ncbi:hypothetical protein HJC23_006293 [Cyclotella cryptica]|uniref:Uncharacterized protein n=1 Tax=Cyclotella cryptica TaxID=29204 RepID=A0ABD3P1P1_9STRA
MLPYKIRKPVYGGSNKPKKNDGAASEIETSSSAAAALPPLFGSSDDDPRIYGGNLQRAILSDLVDLRTRFHKQYREDEERSRRQERQKQSSANRRHGEPGSVFSQFKAVFQQARFGAIHSRAVPSRIDRGEFAQLIYSSCFFLLQDALKGREFNSDNVLLDSDGGLCRDVNEKSTRFMQDAIFAIFALYTLHQTNTLPTDPYAAKSASTQYSNRTPEDLQQSWSFLPLGAANEGKVCRRYYKSPVRIDRQNYLSIFRLRDVCSAIVESCFYKMESGESSCCNCGLVMDGMHVIDRMMYDDEFFSYCEYHGPCGLEGLAGNPVFYNAYYGSDVKGSAVIGLKRKRTEMTFSPESIDCLSTTRILTTTKLNSINPQKNGISDSLDWLSLSSLLQQHMSNLQSIQSELQASRQRQHRSQLQQTSHGDLKPRQRELVEKTLSEVWKCNDGTGARAPYFDMVDILTTVGKPDVGERIDKECGQQQQSSIDVTPPPPSEECSPQNLDEATTNPTTPLPLGFSPSLSSSLCDNIREALSDFHEMVESVRQSILKECEDKIAKERKSEASNDSLAQPDESSAGAQDLEYNGSSSIQDENASIVFDEVSVATGAGKKALSALLSMSTRGEQLLPTKNPELDDFWSVQEQQTVDDLSLAGNDTSILDDTEEISICTGAGKNALSALLALSGFGDRQQNKKPRKRSQKQERSMDKDLNFHAEESSEEEDSSLSDSSTEVGRNALQFLLSRATASHSVPARKPQSKGTTQKIKKQTTSSSAPRSAKRAAKSSKKQPKSSLLEVDDVSVATGGGQKALAELLSNI